MLLCPTQEQRKLRGKEEGVINVTGSVLAQATTLWTDATFLRWRRGFSGVGGGWGREGRESPLKGCWDGVNKAPQFLQFPGEQVPVGGQQPVFREDSLVSLPL